MEASKKRKWKAVLVIAGIAVLVHLMVIFFGRNMYGIDEVTGPKLDAGFITTWPETVKGMLKTAEVNKNDVVYDLGCGDGRIVIAAAQIYGAHGVGIDLNPKRIDEANENAKAAKVEHLVKFKIGDFYKVDYSDATVVALYLPQQINYELRPYLWKKLKVGTRVVSNESDMGPEWPAEKIEKVGPKTVYMWTITEDIKEKAARIELPERP